MRNIIKLIFLLLLPMMLLSCGGHYKKHDGKVYYCFPYLLGTCKKGDDQVLLKGADAKSFEVLEDGYAWDKNRVWHEGCLLKNAIRKSFKLLGNGYATDGAHVYSSQSSLDSRLVDVKDAASFKIVSEYLCKDQYDYYWKGEAMHVADMSSFVAFPISKDGDAEWAKDRQYAYFIGFDRINITDYDTFKPLNYSEKDGIFKFQSSRYAVDKYHVYFAEDNYGDDYGKIKVVPGADPKTFRMIDFNKGQDKNRVYVGAKPSDVKDYKSVKKCDGFYTTDRFVYDDDLKLIKGADPKTFTSIYGVWYKDKNHLFANGKLIEEADIHTFTTNVAWNSNAGSYEGDCHYAKDAHHVYFEDSILVGADPKTFTTLYAGDWVAFDKNRFYEGHENETTKPLFSH